MMNQRSPYCIQVELTEGCNLACAFCGIAAIRKNGANGPKDKRGKKSDPYKYLTYSNAHTLAIKLKQATTIHKWNPRIEMAMHGEPTMNPYFKDIDDLMEAGINVLLLDNYEGIKICDKVREQYKGVYRIREYPLHKEANPHRRRKPEDHDIVVVQDIAMATKGNHSTLNNHAGSAFPKNDRANGKRCAKVFRELSVRWDGNVAICCNDWPGFYRCGNIFEDEVTFESIWQSDPFMAARKKLYHGMRNFGPCAGCDAVSYRPGLLPDPKGQLDLEKPDKKDDLIIEAALREGPYTKAIPRPWEN